MATKIHIIVQPYVSGTKGTLTPAPAIEVMTADAGRYRAERMIENPRIVGVDVVQTEVDSDAGDYSDPVFLARIGQVPQIEA